VRGPILVVDDDRDMVKTLIDVLTVRGWDATGAYSGREAIDAFRRQSFAAVLMDIRMPGIDGLSAMKTMRAERPGIPVLLMTAYSTRDLILDAEREGALSVMPKPLVLPVVLQRLETILRKSRSVLIVDDDAESLSMIAAAVRESGFNALEAPGIDVALRRLEAQVPTAVLLHLRVGSSAPSEMLLAIKRVSPSVALILYAGHEQSPPEGEPAFPEGVVYARLRKPFSVQTLVELLEKVVAAPP